MPVKLVCKTLDGLDSNTLHIYPPEAFSNYHFPTNLGSPTKILPYDATNVGSVFSNPPVGGPGFIYIQILLIKYLK